jgi:hypothetical protein
MASTHAYHDTCESIRSRKCARTPKKQICSRTQTLTQNGPTDTILNMHTEDDHEYAHALADIRILISCASNRCAHGNAGELREIRVKECVPRGLGLLRYPRSRWCPRRYARIPSTLNILIYTKHTSHTYVRKAEQRCTEPRAHTNERALILYSTRSRARFCC